MDDQHIEAARGDKHRLTRRHGRPQSRNVIAKRGTEPTGLEEIALHVDDHERRPVEIDGERSRFSLDDHAWHPDLLPRTQKAEKNVQDRGQQTMLAQRGKAERTA
jgi:hypothetical protein